MAELVDAPDLGSGAERRESSSLSFRTRATESAVCRAPPAHQHGKTELDASRSGNPRFPRAPPSVTLPLDQVNTEIENRLKRLARTVKLHGFRPGKVPLKIVEQQFGGQVRQEVLGDAVQSSFGEAVKEKNLRVAGYPRIEVKPAADAERQIRIHRDFRGLSRSLPSVNWRGENRAAAGQHRRCRSGQDHRNPAQAAHPLHSTRSAPRSPATRCAWISAAVSRASLSKVERERISMSCSAAASCLRISRRTSSA